MRAAPNSDHSVGDRLTRVGAFGTAESDLFARRVVEMTSYTFVARRWAEGWELDLGDRTVTQVRTLARAEKQARDYLETVEAPDAVDAEITIIPEIGSLAEQVKAARRATTEAAQAQEAAAKGLRTVATQLRESGLSLADTAYVLGVSRARVSQLA
jgi:antitoxin component HigA of HigAB toxin-antitoxin module